MRPGTSLKSRTALRTGTRGDSARQIRLGSATMFALGDPTRPLFQSSRLNPSNFMHKPVAKPLFQFLYYHEGDVRKALDLSKTIVDKRPDNVSWWWYTQTGRSYIALGNPRSAEKYLRKSLSKFAHIDTALLLTRVYVKIDQPLAAIDVLAESMEKFPDDVALLTQQARILELIGNLQTSVRIHRTVAQLEPINSEALACIAVHHFYGKFSPLFHIPPSSFSIPAMILFVLSFHCYLGILFMFTQAPVLKTGNCDYDYFTISVVEEKCIFQW